MRLLPRLTLALVLLAPAAAQAHSTSELDAWVQHWAERADAALSPALIAEWDDMKLRHPNYFHTPEDRSYGDDGVVVRSNSGMGSGGPQVERWRSLVATYFPAVDVDRALCLMGYESGGNPDAYNSSGASGLMQVLSGWADDYNVSKAALFDPDTNLRIAADLKRKYGWTQWSPYNRGLCR